MDHPDIIARLDRGQTPVGPAMADTQALASIFGVERVLVSRAVKNTAVEGSSAGTYSFIAGEKRAGLFYVTTPGVMTPMAGITFVWNNSAAGVRSFRLPEAVESDRIENQMWYDQKVIASPLGLIWSSASA